MVQPRPNPRSRRQTRLEKRRLRLESLERRELLAAEIAMAHTIFAPGSPNPDVGTFVNEPQGGRWMNAASGTSANPGDPVTLTWSIVRDGTPLTDSFGGFMPPSTLVSRMDSIYGAGTATVGVCPATMGGDHDCSDRPWFRLFQRAFDDWSRLSGINFVYEPNEQPNPNGSLIDIGAFGGEGVLGERGDIRIGGANVDGTGDNLGNNALGFSFPPTNGGPLDGDIVLDIEDPFFQLSSDGAAGENRAFHNVLMHEIGHGVGLDDVAPLNSTKLMEPVLSLDFFGPQHNDILEAHDRYGDRFGDNDTIDNSVDIGILGGDALLVETVSIDNVDDEDWYSFFAEQGQLLTIAVTPVGEVYDVGPFGGAVTSVDTTMNSDLRFELWGPPLDPMDPTPIVKLKDINANGIGLPEFDAAGPIFRTGEYKVRVFHTEPVTQLYSLAVQRSDLFDPNLSAVAPNRGDLFDLDPLDQATANIRTQSPTELLVTFGGTHAIDPLSITTDGVTSDSISILYSESGDFNDPMLFEEVPIGFIQVDNAGRNVTFRFKENLKDGFYQLVVTDKVTSVFGVPFLPRAKVLDPFAVPPITSEVVSFEIELGAKVIAVVPQPVESGVIRDTVIDVYFDDADLFRGSGLTSVTTASFYQLVDTQNTVTTEDDVVAPPPVVTPDAAKQMVRLEFGATLDTFAAQGDSLRLRIGDDTAFQTLLVTDEGFVAEPGLTPGSSYTLFSSVPSPTPSGSWSVTLDQTIANGALPNLVDNPGAINEPGHRDIEIEDHYLTPGDRDDDDAIMPIEYTFLKNQSYGMNSQGDPLFNQVTPQQEERFREVLDLYSNLLGIDFYETESSGLELIVGDLSTAGDVSGPGGTLGLGGPARVTMDFVDFQNVEDNRFDANPNGFFNVALHEIGHAIGLGHSYDLPPGTIMGEESEFPEVSNTGTEWAFPGDHDLVHGLHLHQKESLDVDLYRVDVVETGVLKAQTFAQRSPDASLLDTRLTLFREPSPGAPLELISANDDYFGSDSYIEFAVEPGVYFIGVSAEGNTQYDPDSGLTAPGGTSEGDYELRVDFVSEAGSAITDADGSQLDGDRDGVAGGNYNFWFEAGTIFVDKSAPSGGAGTFASPFNNIPDALVAAELAIAGGMNGTIVRLLANGGVDGIVETPDDNLAYEVGRIQSINQVLDDGRNLDLPAGVHLVIDAGVIMKFLDSRISVGSDDDGNDRSEASIAVQGTPDLPVYFTSYNDRTLGSNSNPLPVTAGPGDWGGIEIRNDVDRLQGRRDLERMGIFQNYINHAEFRFGGGEVSNLNRIIDTIHLSQARAEISYNTITFSSDAAISADPDTFGITTFTEPRFQRSSVSPDGFVTDYDRVGPSIYGNLVTDNSTNGLFVRIDTPPGGDLERLRVPARFDDTDIVHVLGENLLIQGAPGGPIEDSTIPAPIIGVIPVGPFSGADTHSYRYTFVDLFGFESPASVAQAVGVAGASSVNLTDIPAATGKYVARRLYRSDNGGTFTLVAELDKSSPDFTDDLSAPSMSAPSLIPGAAIRHGRIPGGLVIDPGTIVKNQGARVQLGFGSTLLAEGIDGREILFTSRSDDQFGAGGTFDTNGDGSSTGSPADWAGIYASPNSLLSIDHALVAYGGGATGVQGGTAFFNPIQIHQADARIANTTFASNAGGDGPQQGDGRAGFAPNDDATIYVTAAQPTIVGNDFVDNVGAVINTNVNAFDSEFRDDLGRQTGHTDRYDVPPGNQGPVIRGNQLDGNQFNGMIVRGEVLTTEVVWDDTDIVHVLRNDIEVPDHHTFGGFRLESSESESLVVKLDSGAEILATGRSLDITDRIGGRVNVIGQPGFPVVMTSIHDETVGAGFTPDGEFQNQTFVSNTFPNRGDWQGLTFDPYSHDRNLWVNTEREGEIGGFGDSNADIGNHQELGLLAADLKSGDENLALGFTLHGALASDVDVDLYSFEGAAGTMVWIDIDRTDAQLDTVLELIDGDGRVLARSDNSRAESAAGALDFVNPDPLLIRPGHALPMQLDHDAPTNHPSSGGEYRDLYTTNDGDSAMRVVLPGSAGSRNTFYVKVRSKGAASQGGYQLQLRLQETDDFAGSSVRYADLRYAATAIAAAGLPAHSPIAGEIFNPGGTVNLGSFTNTDRGAISIAGNAETPDTYTFNVGRDSLQGTESANPMEPPNSVGITIDVDYADGLTRPDTNAYLFDGNTLIAIGTDSNISDDRITPIVLGQPTTEKDVSRGTFGARDPFIGPLELPNTGNYQLVIANNSQMIGDMQQFTVADPSAAIKQFRLEPLDSTVRVIDDRFNIGASPTPSAAQGPVAVQVGFNTPHVTTGLITISVGSTSTFTRTTGSFLVDGFVAGQSITTTGFTNAANNGTFTVASISADGLTMTTVETTLIVELGTGNEQISSTSNIIPWQFGDVPLITVRESGRINIHNPFTGRHDAIIQADAVDLGAVASAPNGRIIGIEAPIGAGGANDGNTDTVFAIAQDGSLSPTASTTGIVTFRHSDNGDADPATNSSVVANQGMEFKSLAFFNSTTSDARFLYGVADRPTFDGGVVELDGNGNDRMSAITVPVTPSNVIYRINPNSGAAESRNGISMPTGFEAASPQDPLIQNNAGFNIPPEAPFTGTNVIAQVQVPDTHGDVTALVTDHTANTLFAFTDTGAVWSVTINVSGAGANYGPGDLSGFPILVIDPGVNPINDTAGSVLIFDQVTQGPRNFSDVNDTVGIANSFFGVTTAGRMFAFDLVLANALNNAQNVFEFGADQIQLDTAFDGGGGYAGIFFSQLDQTLWHASNTEEGTAGHGMGALADRPAVGGGGTLMFGFDELDTDFNHLSTGAVSQVNADDPQGFVGYNFLGGAHGSVQSNSIDLSGFSADDLPTLYFTYVLDSGANDALRVSVVGEDGTWSQLAANSSPLFVDDAFRQARLDLSPWAGQQDVRLRFDFSTAGEAQPDQSEIHALPGEDIRDGHRLTIDGEMPDNTADNQGGPLGTLTKFFEFDHGLVAQMPSGDQVVEAGGSITLQRPGLTTVVELITSGVPVLPQVLVLATDTAEIVADKVDAAIAGTVRSTSNPHWVNFTSEATTGTYTFGPLDADGFILGTPGVGLGQIPIEIDISMTAVDVRDAIRTELVAEIHYLDAGPNPVAFPIVDIGAVNAVRIYDLMVTQSMFGQPLTLINGELAGGPNPLPGTGVYDGDTEASLIRAGDRSKGLGGAMGVHIDDIVIGLAERGESATGSSQGTTLVPNPSFDPSEVVSGTYQAEIRLARDYLFDGNVGKDARVEINERLADAFNVRVVSRGSDLVDGDTFTLSNGFETVVFEFNDVSVASLTTTPTPGNVAIEYTVADTVGEVAQTIREAINSGSVRAVLGVEATSRGRELVDTTDPVIVIHGYAAADNTAGIDFTSPESVFPALRAHLVGVPTGAEVTRGEDNGDRNRFRDQGVFNVDSNIIRESGTAINISAGTDEPGPKVDPGEGNRPKPGPVQHLRVLSNEKLVHGAVVQNNLLINNGDGIVLQGDPRYMPFDPDTNDPVVPATFSRVMNNTVFGSDNTAITIADGAAPTLLNNALVENGTGISATNEGPTVVRATLFKDNALDVNDAALIGTEAIIDPVGSLFVNPTAGNFYPSAGSPLIDNSIESQPDRQSIILVKNSVGISESPIIVTELDLAGQIRSDGSSSSGQGNNVNIDIGALDRADTVGPEARILLPIDNDVEGVDLDRTNTIIQLREGLLGFFEVLISDEAGIGPNPATITPSQVVLLENGRELEDGVEVTITYNPTNRTIRLSSQAGLWRPDAVYEIILLNQLTQSPGGSTIVPIADLAGNALQPNRPNGQTGFTIIMPKVKLDFGDAFLTPVSPDTFKTLFENDGARHAIVGNATPRLGNFIDGEPNSSPALPPGSDDMLADIGVVVDGPFTITPFPIPTPSGDVTVTLTAVPASGDSLAVSAAGRTVIFELVDTDIGASAAANRVAVEYSSSMDTPGVIMDALSAAIATALPANNVQSGVTHMAGSSSLTLVQQDDEDGISIGTFMGRTVFTLPGTDPSSIMAGDVLGFLNPLEAAGTNIAVNVFGTGFLNAWVDFDGDGVFEPTAGEQILTNEPVVGDPLAGTINFVTVFTPAGVPDGDYWMRIRISSSEDVGPTGLVVGGEVEDYFVEVINVDPPIPVDDEYEITEDSVLDTLNDGLESLEFRGSHPVPPPSDPSDDDITNPAGAFLPVQFIVGDLPTNGVLVPDPMTGEVIDPVTGHFVYDPNEDFNGIDTFTYRLSNQQNAFSTAGTPVFATVTISVTPVNDAPGAMDQNLTAVEDVPRIITPAELLVGAIGDESPDYMVPPGMNPDDLLNEPLLNEENQTGELVVATLQGTGGVIDAATAAAGGGSNLIVTSDGAGGIDIRISDPPTLTEGDFVSIHFGGTTQTFELVAEGAMPQGGAPFVQMMTGGIDTAAEVAAALQAAIDSAFSGTVPSITTSLTGIGMDTVSLDPIPATITLSETGSTFTTMSDIKVTGTPTAGDTLTVTVDGTPLPTFELIDAGGMPAMGNVGITLRAFSDPASDAARASVAAQLATEIQTALVNAGLGAIASVDLTTDRFTVKVETADITAGKSFETDRGSAIPLFDSFGALIELRYVSDPDLNRDNPPLGAPHTDQFTFTAKDNGVSIDLVNNRFEYGMPLESDPRNAVIIDVLPVNDAPDLTDDEISVGPLGPDADMVLTPWELFPGFDPSTDTPTEDTRLVINTDFLLSNDTCGPPTAEDEITCDPLVGLRVTDVRFQGTSLFDVGTGMFVFDPPADEYGDVELEYDVEDVVSAPLLPAQSTGTVTIKLQPANDIPVAYDRALNYDESAMVGSDTFTFTALQLLDGSGSELPAAPGDFPIGLGAPFDESEQTLSVVGFSTSLGTVDVSDLSPLSEMVTFTSATSTINSAGTAYMNGDRVRFTGGTLPAELSATTTYFVVNQMADDFQISLTAGGPAVVFTDDGMPTTTALSLETLTIDSDVGGTFEFDFVGGVFTEGRFMAPPDYNSNPPFASPATFTYVVVDDGRTEASALGQGDADFDLPPRRSDEDPLANPATVRITVDPTNDAPIFTIPAEVHILEDGSLGSATVNNFLSGIAGGPPSALDEVNQTVTFDVTLAPPGVGVPVPNPSPSDLMMKDPEITGTSIEFFPNPDMIGTAVYVVVGTDSGGAMSPPQTFTVNVQPVNDPPRLDPMVVPTAETGTVDDAYEVDADGTIRYTLREDNTQPDGSPAPYFIPLSALPGKVGLLDVFTPGPANESAQDVSFLSAGNPFGFTTALGGTLSPVFADPMTLTGLHYTPPTDLNFSFAAVDSFEYVVEDNGETFDLDILDLTDDPLTASNRVELVLNPVNDRPQFTTSTLDISVPEDAGPQEIRNYAANISAGPRNTAFDEVDVISGQTVAFEVTPLFANSGSFFTSLPTIDAVTGRLNFQVAPDVFGDYPFSIVLRDSGVEDATRGDLNATIPVTLTINVRAINDPPIVVGPPLVFDTLEDGTIPILVNGDNTSPGLLDPFIPGPDAIGADESALIAPLPGGNQTVSLGTPAPTTSAEGGTIVFDDSGPTPLLRYTPRANFVGTDTFSYTVTDNGTTVGPDGVERSAPRVAANIVTIEVLPVNDAPVFSGAASVTSDEDQGVVVIDDWAANVQPGPPTATDEAGQTLQFNFTQLSANTDLFLSSPQAIIDPLTGTADLTYQTNPNANGVATFEVVLEDNGPQNAGIGDEFRSSPPRQFSINVQAVNDPPSFTLADAVVTRDEDSGPVNIIQAINISPGPQDEISQTVTFEIAPLTPQYASLFSQQPTISSGGVLSFTTAPNRNTDNADGPAIISVTARDSGGAVSASQQFAIEINEVNDTPRAFADQFNTDEDTVLMIDEAQLLLNDVDPDLASNAAEEVRVVMPAQSLSVSGATVTYDSVTGKITYDPLGSLELQALRPGQNLVDSFAYSLIDAAGARSNLVTVALTVAGINDAPILGLDTPQLNPSGSTIIDALANDVDVDGFIIPASLQITLQPAFGSIALQVDGTLIYTPFSSFLGEDVFAYTVTDDLGGVSDESIVTISSNASPIAVDDFGGTFLDESVFVNVAGNDSDPDGALDLGSIVIITQPLRGQAIPQNNGTVQYLPDPGFVGTDSFTYRISDNEGRASNEATVNTRVVPSRLQNPDISADVNGDGFVTAIDPLLIINLLDRDGPPPIQVLPTDVGPPFYDVSGDRSITAFDVLLAINEVNRVNNGSGVNAEQVTQVGSDEPDPVESPVDALAPIDLASPAKIVDTGANDSGLDQTLDLIARDRDGSSDEDEAAAAVDAALGDLL